MSNAVQTTLTQEPAIGRAGMIYDSGPKDVITCIAQEAIPFGSVVRISTQYCELPDSSGEVTAGEMGVAVEGPVLASGVGYAIGDLVPVMRQGRIWVNTEQAVAAQADPFVRFAAGAGGSAKGAIRNDADTATAVAPSGISVYRGNTGAGLAVLQLNYPGTGTGL